MVGYRNVNPRFNAKLYRGLLCQGTCLLSAYDKLYSFDYGCNALSAANTSGY
jgi:hypothetical protein